MKASVIIPAFNAAKTIRSCLEALEHQTVPRSEFEVIVVDDGSRDETAKIVSGFKKVLLFGQKNAGPAMARNRGTKKAAANIVVFLDSDCVCHPTWLSELLKPFSDPTVAGVQGRYKNGVKHWMAEFIQLEIEERYERLQKSMAVKKSIDFVSTYSAAYRKRIFLENGGFDESFRTASGEDTDLSFRISANGHRLVFAPRAVVDHFHPASLLKYWRTKFYRAYWRVHLYRKNPDKIKNDSYTNPLIKFQIIFAGIFLATDFTAKIEFFLGTTAQAFLTGMVSAGALLALFLLSFPAAFFIFKKNWKLGIAAPFILTVNAFLFLLGCAYGLVRLRGLK